MCSDEFSQSGDETGGWVRKRGREGRGRERGRGEGEREGGERERGSEGEGERGRLQINLSTEDVHQLEMSLRCNICRESDWHTHTHTVQ